MLRVFTIGHSNTSLEEFIQRLQQHQMQELIDVRIVPKSGYVPHFNRESLETVLPTHAIIYRFAGNYLGWKDMDFKILSQEADFQKGLRRVLELADQKRVVLMCAEMKPHDCHRHHLITRSLLDPTWRTPDLPEVEVIHILKSGELETVDPNDFGPEQLSLL